jgi:uncharacterized protein (DUF736 family)
MTGIASMSVSKGLTRVVAGVDTSERREYRVSFSSSVGNGWESVSCDGFWAMWVSMDKPDLSAGQSLDAEAMMQQLGGYQVTGTCVRAGAVGNDIANR